LVSRTARRQVISLCAIWLYGCAALAQEQSGDPTGNAKLEINLDARGSAAVAFSATGRKTPTPLLAAMSRTLGCAFANPKEFEVDGDWKFSGACAGAFRKRGLLIGGRIEFAPLMAVLKDWEIERIEVTIRHPRTGFSRFTDDGWALEATSQSLEYTKSLSMASPPAEVRLAFGYRPINFLPISLLLFPIGLTVIMRFAALRARNRDPIVVWFTYWRLFGWVLTATWLLWFQGSTVLDCAALARFLLNDSSKAPLLQVAFYVVPPILVQFICTVTSGAVLARVGAERWILPVTLKHAFWHEPVTIWPLLCLLAGVASLTLFNEVLLGVACLAVSYASHQLLVWLWLRFQNLRRYELPVGELRSRIVELAQRSGIKLKQIYLLPATEGRLAGPCMIRSRRLLLSDALLRTLRQRETEAILVREFVHVRRRHRDILLAAAIVAPFLTYRFAHLPVVAGKLSWSGPLLIWVTPVMLYLLWRHFDRIAAAETARITGDTTALRYAMPKIAQFNLLGLYWQRLERRFFSNGNTREFEQPLEVAPLLSEGPVLPGNSEAPHHLVSGD
jgi:Zn-dependent protease with chaperone function